MLLHNLLDPAWHGCGEEQDLELQLVDLLHIPKNVVDIFLEAQLQHDISLVEDDCLKIGKVNIASVDVVLDSAGGSNENVYSSLELSGLVVNADSTVDCHDLELVVVVLQL